MRKGIFFLGLSWLVILIAAPRPGLAVPNMMGYSGYLTDNQGEPINGSLSMVFRIYDAETGGNLVFGETKSSVPVENGFFSVVLSTNSASGGMDLEEIFSTYTTLYLEVEVDSDPLSPRQRLSPVPWALGIPASEDSDTLAGLNCLAGGDVVKWSGMEWICDIDDTLSENTVEHYITDGALDLDPGTTIGGLSIATGVPVTYLPWSSITERPADLIDGDDDTLAGLTCADAQLPRWNDTEGAWECGDDSDTLDILGASCGSGQRPGYDGTAWVCDDDNDTVGSLSCINGDVAQWNGASWVCDPDDMLTESEVEDYITNGAINLASGSMAGGVTLSTATHIHDWSEIGNRPAGLDDGDDNTYPTEATVETYITNGAINLASGSTLNSNAIATDLENIITVSTSGGHYGSIPAALSAITPTSVNRYLIRVGPGTYTDQVTMKEYCDIEGSGEGITILTFTGSGSFDSTAATVISASNSEVRNLTVRSDCASGNPFCIGVYHDAVDDSSRLTHVRVESTTAPAPASNSYGMINVTGAAPVLRHVSLSITGTDTSPEVYGIYNSGSSPYLQDSIIEVSEGASSGGIYNSGNSNPEICDSKISVSAGSGVAYGIYNVDSSLRIRNTKIEAGGGGGARGIYNTCDPSPYTVTIHTSHIVLGGGGQYGIYNNLAGVTGDLTMGIYSTSITGPVGMWGIFNTAATGPQLINVHSSQVFGGGGGSGGCIETNTNVTVRAGASLLHGAVGGTGTELCGQCYDGGFADLNASCQ